MKRSPDIISKVYLRTPIPEDVDFMLEMENNPEIWAVSETTEKFLRVEITAFIMDSEHDLFRELQQRFVIVLKESDIPIGSVDLFNYEADSDTASVGISILPEYRGNRYGSQALDLLIDTAFNKLKLHSLHCSIFSDNYPSIRLFKSKGFKVDTKKKIHVAKQNSKINEIFYVLEKY